MRLGRIGLFVLDDLGVMFAPTLVGPSWAIVSKSGAPKPRNRRVRGSKNKNVVHHKLGLIHRQQILVVVVVRESRTFEIVVGFRTPAQNPVCKAVPEKVLRAVRKLFTTWRQQGLNDLSSGVSIA